MEPRATLLATAVGAGILLSLPARGGDWPQFRGPNRDGIVSDVRLPTTWPDELKERWRIPLGGGFSSPAVAGGRVFVLSQDGERETAQCLEASSGRAMWRFDWSANFKSSWGGGPRATPTVDGDRVYVVGGTGLMHCLKTADGAAVWKRSFREDFRFRTPEYGYSPSPLIDGERVIVHVGGREGHSVVAMDKLSGKLFWHSQDDPPGYASPMILPASPARGPRQLIIFTERGLVSLNPDDGTPFWRFDWTTAYEQNIAQPMLDQTGNLLVITSLTGCAAFRLGQADGKPKASQAWRNQEMAVHFSCPVAWNGHLYGVHGRKPVLRCLELAGGTVKWTQPLPADQRAGMVLADGRLLVYTDTGQVLVVEASPEGCREQARYGLAGQNWVPPVLADGCLFLRDRDSLRCIELPRGPSR